MDASLAVAAAWAAIQVPGGVGHVRGHTAERHQRGARVFAIHEGTTAIRAPGLLRRRILGSDGQESLPQAVGQLGARGPRATRPEETVPPPATQPPRDVKAAAAVSFPRLFGQLATKLLLAGGDRTMAAFQATKAAAAAPSLASFCAQGAAVRNTAHRSCLMRILMAHKLPAKQ